MTNAESTSTERVVAVVETCEGAILRTFYCIHDSEFGQWMSDAAFDGKIWTKNMKHRREFACRDDAEAELAEFLDWRQGQQSECDLEGTEQKEREAA
jgi:hypothetical protein